MKYLLFRLYGPMASWGEIAVGQSRHSAIYPGKSALLGLMAAALGIRRDEEQRQTALTNGYRFAVKVINAGHPLSDYHTAQAPPDVALKKHPSITRKDELAALKYYQENNSKISGTILSSREYRCDALTLVAVVAEEGAPYSLDELRDALLKPRFHLYLGRKSCPVAVPLNPLVQDAGGFGEALDNYPCGSLFVSNWLVKTAQKEVAAGGTLADAPSLVKFSREDENVFAYGNQPVRYYWEGDAVDLVSQQSLTRHDQPTSRARWQFTQRTESMCFGKEDR